MVLYSNAAKQDLEDILYGLIYWERHPLSVEHALQYVDDIKDNADTICKKPYHIDARYLTHKRYGSNVHTYRRNQHTQWYMIYDWNSLYRVALVNKILNNHLTQI
jgi:plasmid stabilization system protein ParE